MADDEPMADAHAEQVAPDAAAAAAAAADAQEDAPAEAAAAAAPAAAAAAAPPPSTAKKTKAAAPASTKKKAAAAAKPASTPASTPSRAGRERKKVEFFSPPQAVVKEDLVQVKVRVFLSLFVLIFFIIIHQSIEPIESKAHLLLPAFALSRPLFLPFLIRITQGKGTKLSEISNSEYEGVEGGEKRRRKGRLVHCRRKRNSTSTFHFFLTVDSVVFARARWCLSARRFLLLLSIARTERDSDGFWQWVEECAFLKVEMRARKRPITIDAMFFFFFPLARRRRRLRRS